MFCFVYHFEFDIRLGENCAQKMFVIFLDFCKNINNNLLKIHSGQDIESGYCDEG
jgi:hypothetical protein